MGPGDVVRRTLTLAAGKLVLESRLAGAAQKTGEPVSYRIEQLDSAEPLTITTSRPTPELLLASGRYRVEARYAASNVRAVREFELKGGQTLQLALEFAAANVRFAWPAVPVRMASRSGPCVTRLDAPCGRAASSSRSRSLRRADMPSRSRHKKSIISA